jgi:L-iditol 2-dehydrogenase
MKAIRLHHIIDLRLEKIPFPELREDHVLLRTASVSICGSDVHYYKEGGTGGSVVEAPFILGHEFSAYLHPDQGKPQLVSVDPAVPCGHCEYCLQGNPNFCENLIFAGAEGIDGGMCEYLTWHKSAIFPLPASFSPEQGAMLEPLGVAIHALRLGKVFPGMDVGVFGAGVIGLLTIQMAKLAGAARIFATDKLAHRLDIARQIGATHTIQADGQEAKQILNETGNRGLDVTFEAAGDDGSAVESAIESSKRGGTTVLIGIPIKDETRFTASIARRRGMTIKIARRMKDTYPTAIKLVDGGMIDLDPLMTHRFPPEAFQEAFDTASKREGVKVFINFSS